VLRLVNLPREELVTGGPCLDASLIGDGDWSLFKVSLSGRLDNPLMAWV